MDFHAMLSKHVADTLCHSLLIAALRNLGWICPQYCWICQQNKCGTDDDNDDDIITKLSKEGIYESTDDDDDPNDEHSEDHNDDDEDSNEDMNDNDLHHHRFSTR